MELKSLFCTSVHGTQWTILKKRWEDTLTMQVIIQYDTWPVPAKKFNTVQYDLSSLTPHLCFLVSLRLIVISSAGFSCLSSSLDASMPPEFPSLLSDLSDARYSIMKLVVRHDVDTHSLGTLSQQRWAEIAPQTPSPSFQGLLKKQCLIKSK